MRTFVAFTQKEFMESFRTYRIFILAAVFLLLGIMSPLFARFLPEILKSAMPEGTMFEIPEPSAIDSWSQFFSNVGQIGLLTLAVVFGGITAGELSRGTLINILTKGMKRSTVILAKLAAAAVMWTFSYLLCLGVTYLYTVYFWDMGGLDNLFTAFFAMWLFGLLLLALVVSGGIFFPGNYSGLMFAGGAVVVMMLVNINPKLQKYNPMLLSSGNMSLLTAERTAADFFAAFVICSVLIVTLTTGAVLVFNKRKV